MNILLAVSGSIASYKSYDLLRSLVKQGHKVKVVLSEGALKFIRSETFRYLGAQEVFDHDHDFNPDKLSKDQSVLHIELARWCEQFVLYPASANMISKIAHGQCHDLCSSVFLSLKDDVSKIIFPAMNHEMYENKITQANLNLIKPFIIEPNSGLLACQEIGKGKLPLPLEACDLINSWPKTLRNETILINTGATLSPLDPVRYLTNPSSGKTGYELAKVFLKSGYFVELIHSITSTSDIQNLIKHPRVNLHSIQTTDELFLKTTTLFPKCNLFISAAAPSDIVFKASSDKLKKDNLKNSLEITSSKDVLYECLKMRKNQRVIGFAAETSFDLNKIQKKRDRKPVDLLIFNLVSNGMNSEDKRGFGQDANEYHLFEKERETKFEGSKRELSEKVLKWFQK